MVNIFEIGVNILEEAIILSFLTIYLGCKYKGFKAISAFLITLITTVTVLSYMNALYIYEAFLGLLFIALYFVYSLIFLKGDVYTKLFMCGFINCLVYFIALLSTLLVSIIFSGRSEQMYSLTTERIVLIVSSKLLLVISCVILLKYKVTNIAKKRNMALLIIMPVVAEVSTVGIMETFLEYSQLNYKLFLAAISVMLANVLTYYVFIKINKDIEQENEIRAMKQKYESDKKYAQDINELYSKACSIRHDLVKHFEVISGLLENENSAAVKYIQAVTRNQLSKTKSFVKTDNEYFDAIVNAKIAVCEKYDIKVQIRVMNNSLNYLQPDEIGIIFGNLFDNAIEAAKNTNDKIIELDVQIQDNRCSIMMINSINQSVLDSEGNFIISPQNNEYHGFGVKNIKKIVKTYDGMVNYFEENNCLGCDILL